jgi:hypothetical protein
MPVDFVLITLLLSLILNIVLLARLALPKSSPVPVPTPHQRVSEERTQPAVASSYDGVQQTQPTRCQWCKNPTFATSRHCRAHLNKSELRLLNLRHVNQT